MYWSVSGRSSFRLSCSDGTALSSGSRNEPDRLLGSRCCHGCTAALRSVPAGARSQPLVAPFSPALARVDCARGDYACDVDVHIGADSCANQ